MDKLFREKLPVPEKLQPEQIEEKLAKMTEEEMEARRNFEKESGDEAFEAPPKSGDGFKSINRGRENVWKAVGIAASLAVVIGAGAVLSHGLPWGSSRSGTGMMAENDSEGEVRDGSLAAKRRVAAYQVIYDQYQRSREEESLRKSAGGSRIVYEKSADYAYESVLEDSTAVGSNADGSAGTGYTAGEKTAAGAAGAEHSETNVRTEGVDEGDIVKTDGKYIYALKDPDPYENHGDSGIYIYRADGEKTEQTAWISLKKYSLFFHEDSMYVQGDRLVVIGSRPSERGYYWTEDIADLDMAEDETQEGQQAGDEGAGKKKGNKENAGQDEDDRKQDQAAAETASGGAAGLSRKQLEGTLEEETDEVLEEDAGSDLQSYIQRHKKDGSLNGCDGFTQTLVFDISNRAKPKLVRGFFQEGSGYSSRISDGILYVFSNRYMYSLTEPALDRPETYLPKIQGKCVDGEDVEVETECQDTSYTLISSISLENAEYVDQLAVLGGTERYVSADAIYLYGTYYEAADGDAAEEENHTVPEGQEEEGIIRLEDGEVQDKGDVEQEDGNTGEESEEGRGTGKEASEDEVDWLVPYEQVYTRLMKISYSHGVLSKKAEGTVTGSVKDDYCIDENGEHLRLVCTYWSKNGNDRNALYILDSSLDEVGSIKDLAKKESIYSARFLGDMAYFVTYENTDPLFAADVSDPEHPKILSELKVPGFSSYLHPFGENLLLGIGMETNEDGETLGVKFSMFDISDPLHVKEKDKMVLKEYDYAEVLNNPNALLIDTERGIFGMEMQGEKWNEDAEYGGDSYEGYRHYDVFSYDSENGFQKQMTDALDLEDTEEMYAFFDGRGVTIGDYLYVVWQGKQPVAYRMEGQKVTKADQDGT